MMLGLIIAAMTLAACLALAWPLLRPRAPALERRHHDAAIYRDQLAEIEREAKSGVLDPREAEAARTEIGRRLLAAMASLEAHATPVARRVVAPVVVAVTLPAAAAALYLTLGAPHLPGQPLAGRQLVQADSQRTELESQARALEAKLRANDQDEDSWVDYANVLGELGRHAEAVGAWRRAVTLSNGDPEYSSAMAEAMIAAAGGTVTPEARTVFEEIRKFDPFSPQVGFYLGLALVQEGKVREGIQDWLDLIARAPEAPYVPMVRERMERAAREARIDLDAMRSSRLARAPDRDERREQVRVLVERMAARMEKDTPDDVDGWVRLARGLILLGETPRAQAAFARAASLAPDKLDVQAEYAESFKPTLRMDQPLPAEFVQAVRRVLALDGENQDALWWVGAADAAAGNRASAIALWTKLVEKMPTSAPEAGAIREAIAKLRSAN